MSAKNFRFRSPGVRIEEIDESTYTLAPSFSPGPVIVGRSQHGPILKPVTVASVDEFTGIFGVPSPGGIADTDLWRGENTTAPDYGSYAALAYLRNSSPVTFIRLGGFQHPNVDASSTNGKAGWQTTLTDASNTLATNGGAYGLWLIPSGTAAGAHGTGSLAAVFYINEKSSVLVNDGTTYQSARLFEFGGKMDVAEIKLRLSSSVKPDGFGYTLDSNGSYYKDVAISMNPGAGNFIRKAFNTSPILTNGNLVDKQEYYWLGETYEDYIKDLSDSQTYTSPVQTLAFIAPLTNDGTVDKGTYRFPAKEAKTGFVFAQDDGIPSAFDPINTSPTNLFRIVGLTEGNWASKNLKISISNVSYTPIDGDAEPYGTFNVEVRAVADSDDAPILLESYEQLNLNPRSSRFIGRVIGTQYLKWDATNNKVEIYGDYPNQSRYIRVELDARVKVGGADAKLLPFGFTGPARRKAFQIVSGSVATSSFTASYLAYNQSYAFNSNASFGSSSGGGLPLGSIHGVLAEDSPFTASLKWPDYLLRGQASNATRGLARNAYFGVRTSRLDAGRYSSDAYLDLTYPLENDEDSWVATGTTTAPTFAFSLDDVSQVSSSAKGWQDDASWAQGNRSTVGGAGTIGLAGSSSFLFSASVNTGSSGPGTGLDNQWIQVEDAQGYSLKFLFTGSNFDITKHSLEADTILVGISGSGTQIWNSVPLGYLSGAIAAAQFATASNNAAAGSFTGITWNQTATIFGTTGVKLTQKDTGTAGNTTIYSSSINMSGVGTVGRGFTGTFSSSYAGGVDAVAATYGSITAANVYYKALGANKSTLQSEYRYSSSVGWKTVLDAGYNAFTMPMHAGFDGVDIKQKNPFSITNVAGGAANDGRTNYAWFSILTALKQLRDPEYLDFNLAAMPGVVDSTLNEKLADYCQERGDSLALLDVDSGYRPLEDIAPADVFATSNRGTVSGAVDYRRNSLNNVIHSYAASFYPWVDITDGRTNSVVSVPPTVAMMGVFGRVNQTSEVWFAPAGFQRGGLSDGSTGLRVVNVKDRLTSSERDELYDAGVNPIANFPAEGIVVFGQKTLQLQRSALDRINVRRLMIYLKRQIGGAARRTLFEQNVKATWENFTNQAEAILEEVKDGLGLMDYKFILDETTTTPDLIDQNILYAKLYVKPARAIEYIALDFVITKTGAEFPE